MEKRYSRKAMLLKYVRLYKCAGNVKHLGGFGELKTGLWDGLLSSASLLNIVLSKYSPLREDL